MVPREKNTIEAINFLMEKFPFASCLLIYGLIEQELKFFLLRERRSYSKNRVDDSVTISRTGKCFSKFTSLSDSRFVRECLHYCTLGTLERILRIKSRGISKRRNNIMHLNKYVQSGYRKPEPERTILNKLRLTKAIEDLVYCSDRFFDDKVIYQNETLLFKREHSTSADGWVLFE